MVNRPISVIIELSPSSCGSISIPKRVGICRKICYAVDAAEDFTGNSVLSLLSTELEESTLILTLP